MVVPAPTIVTVLPLTVATDVLLLAKLTVKLEEAVADRGNGASPKVFAASAANVMVWLACTVRVCGTLVAAAKFVLPA